MPRWAWTVILLLGSNVFMTFAWYYHLKKGGWSLFMAIGLSWLIALPEYCLQVPANRLGHVAHGGPFTAAQLKVMQEAITLVVFALFAAFVLKERLLPRDWIAFGLIFLAVLVSKFGPA